MEGKAQASRKWSVLAWFELQGHTVDAKPLASGLGSIRKHMAEVSFTLQGKDAAVSHQENSSTWLPLSQSPGVCKRHFCIRIWLRNGKNGFTESSGSKQSNFPPRQRVKLRPCLAHLSDGGHNHTYTIELFWGQISTGRIRINTT